MTTTLDLDKFRSLLEAQRESLLENPTDPESSDITLDQTRVGRVSRMDAIQAHEFSLEAQRRRETDLKRIEVALEKLNEGDYGWCDTCGEGIAAGRLEVDPAATLCIDCATEAEQNQSDY